MKDFESEVRQMVEGTGPTEGSPGVREFARDCAAFYDELLQSGIEIDDALTMTGDWMSAQIHAWARYHEEE